MKEKFWTLEREQQLIEMAKTHDRAYCANFFKQSKDNLTKKAQKLGFTFPRLTNQGFDMWSEEEVEIISKMAKEGKHYIEMAPFLPKRSLKSIRMKAYLTNNKNDLYNNRKHFCDEKFWDVPNPINSYFAGLIATDGGVHKRRTFSLALALQDGDEDIIEQFKIACRATNKVNLYPNYSDNPNEKGTRKIYISSLAWEEPLRENFGIVPNKTFILQPPKISEDLFPYYVAGAIDGDGTYSISSKDGSMYVGFISASKIMAEWLMEFSMRYNTTRCTGRRVCQNEAGHWIVRIGSHPAAKMAHDLMSLPCPHLKRKYERVRNYLAANPKFNLCLPEYQPFFQ